MSTTSEKTLGLEMADNMPTPPQPTNESVDSETDVSPENVRQSQSQEATREQKSGDIEPTDTQDSHIYPNGPSLALIVLGLVLAVFCLGLVSY